MKIVMNALVYDGTLQYVRDYPAPEPQNNEALIKVSYGGICNTDIEITKGYMGFKGVLGHEFVGVVKKCSDKALLGKRVVGEINIGCGRCTFCLGKRHNHCPKRQVLGILNKDGVFAEYATLPMENLHTIPDTISDEEAVFVEPLAAAYEIFKQITVTSSERVCVLGDGKLGNLVAQALAAKGSAPIVVGKHPEKLSLLEEMDIHAKLNQNFMDRDFDVVIDCTGSPSGIKRAIQLVRPEGTIVLKTTVARNAQVDLNQLVIHEIKLIGSRCGPFSDAIEAIRSRQVDLSPLISGVFPLSEGIRAFQDGLRKDTLKVLLKIE